jgi:hypothetical protein
MYDYSIPSKKPASVLEALRTIEKDAAGEGNYIVEGDDQSFHINVRVVKKS